MCPPFSEGGIIGSLFVKPVLSLPKGGRGVILLL